MVQAHGSGEHFVSLCCADGDSAPYSRHLLSNEESVPKRASETSYFWLKPLEITLSRFELPAANVSAWSTGCNVALLETMHCLYVLRLLPSQDWPSLQRLRTHIWPQSLRGRGATESLIVMRLLMRAMTLTSRSGFGLRDSLRLREYFHFSSLMWIRMAS